MRGRLEIELVSFDAAQLQQVFDQLMQSLAVARDHGHEVARRRRVVDGTPFEGLGGRANGRDGGAQLVRNIGHEVAAHATRAGADR